MYVLFLAGMGLVIIHWHKNLLSMPKLSHLPLILLHHVSIITLSMYWTPPFLPFVTIIVLSKLINICSSICNTCALNRLKIFNIIFFSRWRGKKPASAFFKWLPQVSITNFKGLHNNYHFVMVIGIFVVSSNTICETTTHAYRSTQLLYSIRKFILLPGTQPGTNTPKHWVQFYAQIFFFLLESQKNSFEYPSTLKRG